MLGSLMLRCFRTADLPHDRAPIRPSVETHVAETDFGSLMDKHPGTALRPAGLIASVLGAMLLIFLARNVFHWV